MPQPKYPEVDKAYELGFSNLADKACDLDESNKSYEAKWKELMHHLNRYYNTSTAMYQTDFDKEKIKSFKEQIYVRQNNIKRNA